MSALKPDAMIVSAPGGYRIALLRIIRWNAPSKPIRRCMVNDKASERPDLTQVWHRVQERLGRHPDRSGATPPFTTYAWDSFDPEVAIPILASPERSYFAHKEVLFAAFCTWVVAPHKPNLIRSAVALQAAAALSGAERRARAKFDEIGQLGDIFVRVAVIGPEFFEQIYYPIGGLRALLQTRSRRGFQTSIRKFSRSSSDISGLLRVYHYHVDALLHSPIYLTPSQKIAADVLPDLSFGTDKGNSRGADKGRRIKGYWRWLKRSAPFCYAASQILSGERGNLLEELQDGRFSLEKKGGLLLEWLGKTRYVTEEILPKVATPTDPDYNPVNLSQFAAIPFPAPELIDSDRMKIEQAFLQKKFRKGKFRGS